ncbi:MAG: hypothetical protein GKR96_00775 [Gammaproteobacteria bacterium]|nr:hypothetical protein [Gammaproteobacteria bacterium]
MSDNNGFVDLRIGQGAQGMGDDSVWPSFTDIMTVIVMIFLMALVVIMLRNSELDHELGITKNEQAAVSVENNELVEKLSSLKAQLVQLETSLGKSTEQNQTLKLNLDEEQKRYRALAVEQSGVKKELSELLTEWTELTDLKKSLLIQTETIRNKFADDNQGPLTINQAIALIMTNNEKLKKEKQKISDELEGLLASNLVLSGELEVASETANELSDRKASLVGEIQVAQDKIENLESKESILNEKIEMLNHELAKKEQSANNQIAGLSDENQALKSVIDSFSLQLTKTETLLNALKEEKQALNEKLATIDALRIKNEEQFAVVNQQVMTLTELLEEEKENKLSFIAISNLSEEKLLALQKEYQDLELKYKTLVRPARSTLGKYVVAVSLLKNGNDFIYEYRLPDGEVVTLVSEESLHDALQALKDAHGKELYTQVIIPPSTLVSHADAWKFTERILNAYDYYAQ